MKIIVCSPSPLKLDAVRVAADRVWPDGTSVEISSDVSTSHSPNQPFGDTRTLTSALRRVADLEARRDAGCYAVAIENGIVPRGHGGFADLAYVVISAPDGHVTVRSSRYVLVPSDLVEAARKSGWTRTCGELEAARTLGVDPANPHVVWSGGKTGRRELLTAAIEEALRAACAAVLDVGVRS